MLTLRLLIIAKARERGRSKCAINDLKKPAMNDLIYIGITVLFFIASGLYARFCAKL